MSDGLSLEALSESVHSGQAGGEIALLEGEAREMLFSEEDRRNAAAALDARACDAELVDRLNRLFTEGKSHQALYYLCRFAEHGMVQVQFSPTS